MNIIFYITCNFMSEKLKKCSVLLIIFNFFETNAV